MLTKKTVLLAKKEVTYGSDPTPTAGANAIMAFEPSISIVPDMLERYPGNSDLSRFPELRGKTLVEVKFTTELKGSGTAGTAPRTSPLFQACGMSETIVSSTSVTYALLSSSFVGVTLYVYYDGIYHIVTGCVGEPEFVFEAGQTPKVNWTFRGIYQIPTDTSIVSPTFDSTVPNICKAATMTFGSYSAIIEKLTLKLNNVIAERPDFNQTEALKGFQITGRNPEGMMTVEAVPRATSNADFYSYFHSGTVKALSHVLGATSGNIITLAAGQCYLRAPALGDRDGLRTFDLSFQAARSSGNDEMSLVLT